ncbi:hypothetical protein B0H14DRAFT_2628525 [Mycena olivaceomarginata]|nr:hypothetical protein B0H14DRAFT_2628525 [Mycena olivaceomarginata]
MYLAVEYWRGIASSTRFPGFKLEKCLNTLHIDIVTSWNFNDPDKLLRRTAFVERMRTITQVVVPREEEVTDWFLSSLASGTVKNIIGTAGAVSAATHPIVFPIVAENLFVIVLALGPPNLLSQTEIEAALHKYTSGAADGIHTEIREYCNEATFAKIYRSSKAEEKITELIGNHHVKWEKAEPMV